MDEEEKKPEGEEGTTDDSGDGDKPQTSRLVDDTNLAAKRMEEANEKKEALLDREEENYSKMKLGGRAEGGQEASPAKEETPKEYNDRIGKEISEGKHDE